MVIRVRPRKLWIDAPTERLVREADSRAVRAFYAGDESRLHNVLRELHSLVEHQGEELPRSAASVGSDAALPPRDLPLQEARLLFATLDIDPSFLLSVGEPTATLRRLLASRPELGLADDLRQRAAARAAPQIDIETLIEMLRVFDEDDEDLDTNK